VAGFVREPIRAQFFRTLQRALQTDDGREMVVEALSGLTAWRPALPADPVPPPYDELGRAAEPPRDYTGTVFITARFRTGSTLLWNIFRHVDGRVAYYEPLNERRWFDPASRGSRVDRTHRGVDDYWREYEGLADLGQIYREAWVDRGLVLDEGAWQPGLRAFFARLIDHAAPGRAVLQCNRIDFRLPWIRRQFPGATIVHLYRHPRDQWCSSLVKPSEVPKTVTMAAFEPHDHFYLGRWARDLQRHFPFLGELRNESPYRVFYLIWRLSHLTGVTYAHHSLSYEALGRSPQTAIAGLLAHTGDVADADRLAELVSGARFGGWTHWADDAWFKSHESACESILEDFLRGAS